MDKINNNIPVISVITVCFNNKDGLEKTLKSFAAQNFSQKEIIVVDGGIHDGTEKTIQRYKNIIDHFICESDNGIYDAINKGIRRASGKWVVCMNAGDIFASDTVLSEILDRDIPGDKQFLYSDYAEIDGHGKITIKPSDRKKGLVFHQSAIYRRSLHDEYGYYTVTRPYTVSDLMFFLAVPERLYMKVDTVISLSDTSGISRQGLWCARNALCMRVVYGIENMHIAYVKYWKYILTVILRKITRIK